MDAAQAQLLPEWQVAQWFNTGQPLRVADLRGQVVLIHAFQMLCPGLRDARHSAGAPSA